MKDHGRVADDQQTALLRAEGELRLNGAPNPKAPPRCLRSSSYKAPAEMPGLNSGAPMCSVGDTSSSPKTIQSP
jgi:hypothetical protein